MAYLEFSSGGGIRIFLIHLVLDIDLFMSDAIGKYKKVTLFSVCDFILQDFILGGAKLSP